MDDLASPAGPIPSDFAPVVRRSLPKACAYLVAGSGMCVRVRDEELQKVRRTFLPIGYDELAKIELVRYRVVAFLVCAEQEYERLLEWLYDRTWNELKRVFLYVPDGLGGLLPRHRTHHRLRVPLRGFDEFGDFHKQFGLQFNRRIYFDAKDLEDQDV